MTENNATTFADVLSTIPHNIGETPMDSMVLILVKDGSIIANLVFVMPDRDITPQDVLMIVKKCQRVEFEHFFAVAYTDRPSKCGDHPAGLHESQLIDLFMGFSNGASVIGGGLVTSEHFIDFSEEGEDYPKHPLSEIAESPTALHLAVEHSHEGAAMKVDIPEPDLATTASTLAIDMWLERQPQFEDFADITGSPFYDKARELWERCLARDFGPTRPEAVDLIAFLNTDGLRDRLIVDVSSKTEDEATFVKILKGMYDIHYSRSRMDNAISVLLNLFQYARPRHRNGLYVALAFLEYHRGSNLQALEYLEAIPEKHRTDEYHVLTQHISHGGMSISAQNQPLP